MSKVRCQVGRLEVLISLLSQVSACRCCRLFKKYFRDTLEGKPATTSPVFRMRARSKCSRKAASNSLKFQLGFGV